MLVVFLAWAYNLRNLVAAWVLATGLATGSVIRVPTLQEWVGARTHVQGRIAGILVG